MKNTLVLLATIMFVLVIAACNKSSNTNNNSNNCDIDLIQQPAPQSGTITYSITGTGSFSVTSVSYYDATGAFITENNPSIPYNKTFNIASGNLIKMNVKGVTTSGKINAKYAFVYVSGGSNINIEQNNSCSN